MYHLNTSTFSVSSRPLVLGLWLIICHDVFISLSYANETNALALSPSATTSLPHMAAQPDEDNFSNQQPSEYIQLHQTNALSEQKNLPDVHNPDNNHHHHPDKKTLTNDYDEAKDKSFHYPEETLKQLAKHPQWQHLLFYKNHKAEVISPNFYLTNPTAARRFKFSPYQELTATLALAHDQEIVCQYPARFFWLSEHLPNFQIDLSQCQDLPNPKQDISLILVSNYLKNPASSFGHVLISTNDTDSSATSSEVQNKNHLSSKDLLNQSYNFGARIPSNENGVLYALKGLFGFYDAGFSQAEFFKQDAVYSKKEQRDMWEYVLKLDDKKRALLNYHLYEAQKARFDYYFIKQNCGYRSGELLELISDIKTTDRTGGWYAPDFVFDQLTEYHQQNHHDPLIAQVRYLPSEQTQLRQKFQQLPKSLQYLINQFLKTENFAILDNIEPEQQALALDFLIAHRNYVLSQDQTPHDETIKKQLISKRFTLPVNNAFADLPIEDKPSPALSNKTTLTALTLNNQHQAKLNLTMFVKDPLNAYVDIDKKFEAMKFVAQYDNEAKNLSLDEFVFLDMQQIENLRQPLSKEPKLSWQLKTGVQKDRLNDDTHQTYLQADVGIGSKLADYQLLYGLIGAKLHDKKGHLDGQLEVGFRAKNQQQGIELSYKVNQPLHQQERQEQGTQGVAQVTFRQLLSKNNDFRLQFNHYHHLSFGKDEHDTTSEIGVSFHHYW